VRRKFAPNANRRFTTKLREGAQPLAPQKEDRWERRANKTLENYRKKFFPTFD
jgi:hypothetical protein